MAPISEGLESERSCRLHSDSRLRFNDRESRQDIPFRGNFADSCTDTPGAPLEWRYQDANGNKSAVARPRYFSTRFTRRLCDLTTGSVKKKTDADTDRDPKRLRRHLWADLFSLPDDTVVTSCPNSVVLAFHWSDCGPWPLRSIDKRLAAAVRSDTGVPYSTWPVERHSSGPRVSSGWSR